MIDLKCTLYLLDPKRNGELFLVLRTFSTNCGNELYNNLTVLRQNKQHDRSSMSSREIYRLAK